MQSPAFIRKLSDNKEDWGICSFNPFSIPFFTTHNRYNGKRTTPKEETKSMEKNILEAFQPNIVERLGEVYWRDDGYRAAFEKEKELANRVRETFSGEQMDIVEEYHSAISATMGICELLAYRQGMKDMVSILK